MRDYLNYKLVSEIIAGVRTLETKLKKENQGNKTITDAYFERLSDN